MKRTLSVALAFGLFGCTHVSQVPRSVSSVQELDEIDSKLEQPWKGDLNSEHQTLRDLGKVIGGFVAKEAQQHQAWRQELDLLNSQKSLSKKQQRRKKALMKISSRAGHLCEEGASS